MPTSKTASASAPWNESNCSVLSKIAFKFDLSETSFANAATVGDLEKLLQKDNKYSHAITSHSNSPRFHFPHWTLRWPTTWLRLASHFLLARPAIFLLGRPRIIGRENLRRVHGPLLVVSNHVADVDIGFIQTALPARIRNRIATATGGEALEKLRGPGRDRAGFLRIPLGIYDRIQWTLAIALLNLFPLPRQSGFRKSFAYAGEAVDHGYSVLVFPKGKHTMDGKIQPFRTGVGLLANNLTYSHPADAHRRLV